MTKPSNDFNTMEVHPWNKPQLQNSKQIANPFNVATGAPIGLNWLDVGKHDRDFQFGLYFTGGNTDNRGKWSSQVTFDQPYASTPKVVVWLREFDLDKNHQWNIKVYADNVTATGFTLHIKGSSDWMYKTTACWIAHPSKRSNITSGKFDSLDVCPASQPKHQHSKSVTFDKKFEQAPRVYAALDNFNVSKGANMRIKVFLKDVTTRGVTLKIESWGDTTLNSAGVSSLAIEEY